MTNKQIRDFVRRSDERMGHYWRLGWFGFGEITHEVLDDDQLWEKAKGLPIDPNNWSHQLERKFKELKKWKEWSGKSFLRSLKRNWQSTCINVVAWHDRHPPRFTLNGARS